MKKISPKILWKKAKHAFANIGSDADKDWRIILSLFIVLLVGSLLWHIDLYFTIGNGTESAEVINQKNNLEVNETMLTQMIDTYSKRADEFHIIQNNKKVSIDPAQ